MKYCRLFLFFAALIASALTVSFDVSAIEVTPQPEEYKDSPLRITGLLLQEGQPVYVQLFNDSAEIISLSGWKLIYTLSDNNSANQTEVSVPLNDWLLPKAYMVVAQQGMVTSADTEFTPANVNSALFLNIQLTAPKDYSPRIADDKFEEGISYELSKSSAGNYIKSSKFLPASENTVLYGGGKYSYPQTTALRVSEILANPADCPPLSSAPNCTEFVELHNTSSLPVDVSAYRLRVGWANQSPSITNTVTLSGMIPAGGYMVLSERDDGEPLSITASGGSIWLEDAQGLVPYEQTVYQYPDIGGSDYKGYSWAKSSTIWGWADASPGKANRMHDQAALRQEVGQKEAEQKPCRDDQYRNPQTNRCKLKSAVQQAEPCKIGQYRNPETNRCKSMSASTSALKPCEEGQVRNPATNRCRSATSASSELEPCAEGKERNPETNRCRKVASSDVPNAAYAPQPVEAAGEAFLGWWVLGGVGALALGRLGWEWRDEIRQAVSKVAQTFTSGK